MRYFLFTLAAIALFLIGLFVGHARVTQEIPAAQTESKIVSESVRGKLQGICDRELADYYKLKTLEERYKKADEILGMVIQIFLADLGLHLSPKTLEAAHAAIAQQTLDHPAPQSATDATNSTETTKPSNAKGPQSFAPDPVKEEGIANVRDEREVNDLLNKLRLEDLYSSMKDATGVKGGNEQFLALVGKFSGSANVTIEGASKFWTVDLDIAITKRGEKPEGNLSLILSENGKAFSNKSGNGGFGGDIKEFKNGSQALLIHVSPSRYLQLYYLKSMDAVAGNFYESEKDGMQFNFIGTTLLHRVGR